MAKKTFWNAYDHLGGCILVNLFWSLLSLPWLGLTALLLTLSWTQIVAGRALVGLMVAVVGIQQLMVSPASAALWAVTGRWVHYQGTSVKEFFPDLKKFFLRSLGLWLFFTLIAFLLVLNAAFYHHLPGKLSFLGALAAGLMGWAYLFLCLVQVYALPLLVQEDLAVKSVLRRSVLLVLDNIGYSLCLVLLAFAVLIVGLVSVAGLLFLAVGLAGVLTNTGLREILRKYEPEKRGPSQTNWAEIRETQGKVKEESRGWRDLWKPWEK
jgi:uncharacterized membrane protein YesL